MLLDAAQNPYIPLFSVVTVLAAVFLVSAAGRMILRYRREGDPTDMKWAAAMIAATVIIVGAMAYIVIEQETKESRVTLYYSVEIETNSTAKGVVWVPVTLDEDLQDALGLVSGTGAFDLVETEHGLALMLEYEGNVTIRGKVEMFEYPDDWGLSMRDGNVMVWARLEGDPGSLGDVVVHVYASRSSWNGGTGEVVRTDLDEGWGRYQFEDEGWG
jgi:hypothetical protein